VAGRASSVTNLVHLVIKSVSSNSLNSIV
jgi:hypothetical protein